MPKLKRLQRNFSYFLNILGDIKNFQEILFIMAMQKQCPSCTKTTEIRTIDGNPINEMNRCNHCGFMIRVEVSKFKLKSSDFGA